MARPLLERLAESRGLICRSGLTAPAAWGLSAPTSCQQQPSKTSWIQVSAVKPLPSLKESPVKNLQLGFKVVPSVKVGHPPLRNIYINIAPSVNVRHPLVKPTFNCSSFGLHAFLHPKFQNMTNLIITSTIICHLSIRRCRFWAIGWISKEVGDVIDPLLSAGHERVS